MQKMAFADALDKFLHEDIKPISNKQTNESEKEVSDKLSTNASSVQSTLPNS